MSILLEFNKTPQFLIVMITGEWTLTDVLKSIEDIKTESDKQEAKLILLDLQGLSSPDSEMTRFYSGEKIASVFGSFYKIAGYSQIEKINRFAETVAINRYANFKMFTSETDAINWLQS